MHPRPEMAGGVCAAAVHIFLTFLIIKGKLNLKTYREVYYGIQGLFY